MDEQECILPAPPLKQTHGRGAVGNHAGPYERYAVEAADDGWPVDPNATPPLRTTINRDTSKSVITRNKSPDISFDQSINPYRGCEHGCVYCFARPTHAWLGLSPGLDFESQLFAKNDAAEILIRELAAKNYAPKLIAIGTNTDPYQPIERKLKIMRDVLGILRDTRHPVTITTKSDAILRDLDILQEMAAENLVHVTISVTTLDKAMARTMEPRAAAPHRRMTAIGALAAARIPVAVNVAPIIPGLTDHELEQILSDASDAGAMAARYILLRLPLEVKDLFEEWLTAYFPDRKNKVLSLIRSARGGKLNDPNFGSRMAGSGAYADIIRERFRKARTRHRLDPRDEDAWLDTTKFRPPRLPGSQMTLDL
jgi:DNA repair photolyase